MTKTGPACVLAILAACPSALAQDPRVEVAMGLGGKGRPAATIPVRIDVEGGTEAESVLVRIRDLADGIAWEVPLDVPAGARRRVEAVIGPGGKPAIFEWSAGAAAARRQTLALHEDGLLVVLGDGPTLVALAEALRRPGPPGGSPSGPEVAVVPLDEAPGSAAGWAAAQVIVLRASDSHRLSSAQAGGLRDRVLLGALLVVHGTDPVDLPRELVPARHVELGARSLGPDGSSPTVPAWSLEPLGAARPIGDPIDGRTWAVAGPVGRGHVILVGLDLGSEASRSAIDAQAWRAMLAGVRPVDAGLRESRHAQHGTVAPPGPAASPLAGLGVLAGLAILALVAWRENRRAPRPALHWLLGAAVAGGVVAATAARVATPSAASGELLVLEERFAGSDRVRVTRYAAPAPDGAAASSAAEAVVPVAAGGRSPSPFAALGGFATMTVRLGPRPTIRQAARWSGPWALQAEAWTDAEDLPPVPSTPAAPLAKEEPHAYSAWREEASGVERLVVVYESPAP